MSKALESGQDVAVWPGGEVDAMRSWWKRDVAVLGGRTGFVKQAIRSGVPILPGPDSPFDLVVQGFSLHDELAEFVRAAELTRNERERELLHARARAAAESRG